MPAFNPMGDVINIGGEANVGPVSARGNVGANVDDHHVSAGIVLLALGVLFLLWQSKFRFSMTVGGG